MKTGWQRRKVSEIAQHSLGKMLDKAKNKGEMKPYLRNLNVRWFGFDLSDILNMRFLPEESAKYTAVKGDVLVCEGGYPGRAAIWERDEPVFFQKALHRVRFHEPERSKWFLYYLHAKDLDGTLSGHFNGAGIQHFTGEALARFEIPLPPLVEQRRIVGALDEAFKGIAAAQANAEKSLRNASGLFESYLEAIFTTRRPGWREKLLGDLVTFRNGINYTKNSQGERIKVVGVKDFQSRFSAPLDDLEEVTIDGALSELDSLRRNDILTVRSNGNVGLIGRCLLVEGDALKVSHSGFTIRIRLLGEEILPRYLCHFLKSAGARKRIIAGGTGTNIKSLNQRLLAALVIPFPPISEQEVLIDRLQGIWRETRQLEAVYQRKLTVLDELKRSLLHQAFSGAL